MNNPKGVVASGALSLAQPRWGWTIYGQDTQGSRCGQPWALGLSPVGAGTRQRRTEREHPEVSIALNSMAVGRRHPPGEPLDHSRTRIKVFTARFPWLLELS